MIRALQKRALLCLEGVPGALELFRKRKESILTLKVAGDGDKIKYSMVSDRPIRVEGGVFRILVRDTCGDTFWLLLCTTNQIGLVLWLSEFSA